MKNIEVSREKREDLIIEAARRRFGLYGVEKTSMREVAADLRMSKGSLYYYFADKENLYIAVIQREQSEFISIFEKEIKSISDPAERLLKYASNHLSHFKKLLNLSRIRSESFHELKPVISEAISIIRENEKKIVIGILQDGRQRGKFLFKDADETATIFLDLLMGLKSTFLRNKQLLIISDEEYKVLSEKVTAFSKVFIKGLMYRECPGDR